MNPSIGRPSDKTWIAYVIADKKKYETPISFCLVNISIMRIMHRYVDVNAKVVYIQVMRTIHRHVDANAQVVFSGFVIRYITFGKISMMKHKLNDYR